MAETIIVKANSSNIYDLLGIKRYSSLMGVWEAYFYRISALINSVKSGDINAGAEASLLKHKFSEIFDPSNKMQKDLELAVSDPGIEFSFSEEYLAPEAGKKLSYLSYLAFFGRYNMNAFRHFKTNHKEPYTGKINGKLFIEKDGLSLIVNHSEREGGTDF